MTLDFKSTIAATPKLLLRHDLVKAAADPKYIRGEPPIYIPEQDYERARKYLPDGALAVAFDPKRASAYYSMDAQQGLLYLPYPYLVPGGRFNSMYGWDTAFPVFAWAADHPAVMREQVDNQLYQIRMYGKVLNANRTYHLSRSQPPLIAAMVLCVYKAALKTEWSVFDPSNSYTDAKDWLAKALEQLQTYYAYWTTGDRIAGQTTLSRYWDESSAPGPEVLVGEPGHFEHAVAHFTRSDLTTEELAERELFYDIAKGELTPLYYRADRAMRASGFDPTGHWGLGALRCMFTAPTCLNSLLYRMEGDMAEISAILNRADEAAAWTLKQSQRKAEMQRIMFNPETGLYEDFDFIRQQRNSKPFGTAFHAIWAGLYESADEARQGATYALSQLETAYGVSTSTEFSGSQWDHPYGWPPLQYFAFAGLQRCGLTEEAERLAGKYIKLASHVFDTHGALFEKYNVRDGNTEIAVVMGYHDNATENGTFLWTAATLKMAADCLDGLKL